MSFRRIPDRWEEYKSLGDRIKGTRFIAFKVPLKHQLISSLSEEKQFTPQSLLNLLEEKGLNIGLIIDLTNTSRYYNKKDFTDGDIQYKKIFTEGRVVPKKYVRMQFFDAVDAFLESNSDEDVLVGVHCTHGLNRTGYLVCRYMIDKLKFAPDDAIAAYNEARGHDIERENYLEDLRTNCSVDAEDEFEGSQTNGNRQRQEANRSHRNKYKHYRRGRRGRRSHNPYGNGSNGYSQRGQQNGGYSRRRGYDRHDYNWRPYGGRSNYGSRRYERGGYRGGRYFNDSNNGNGAMPQQQNWGWGSRQDAYNDQNYGQFGRR